MRWWWVNHGQTRDQEVGGGYLWSPKRDKNGARNQAYVNMTLVRPGDVVFSFSNGTIGALGIAQGRATEGSKPKEFGSTGRNWSKIGWLLRVSFTELVRDVPPKSHMEEFAALRPQKYSPIQANGNGNQKLYLTEISEEFGVSIMRIAGIDALSDFKQDVEADAEAEAEVKEIIADRKIGPTEKMQIIAARRGQGKFKANVARVETGCRVTGVTDIRYLRASHIKPWSRSSNKERLDGHNGLLLSPHVDHLFDKGYLSFSDDGSVLLSSNVDKSILSAWQLALDNVGAFSQKQKHYLNFHRKNVFKE